MYKSFIKTFLALFILSFINSQYSIAQTVNWKELSPFYGTITTCIAKHPSGKLFLGTQSDGLYYSDDDGVSWKQSWYYKTNIFIPSVNSIAIDLDGIIFIGIDASNKIFKSMDGGITWVECNYSQNGIFCLATNDKGELFVGSKDGIYISKDRGGTWSRFLETVVIVRNIIIKNNTIYATLDQIGLLVSKDQGKNWSLSYLPQAYYWSLLVANEYDIYVVLYSGGFFLFTDGLYKSSDGGLTWSKCNVEFKNRVFDVTSLKDGSILTSVDNGKLFRSIDKGKIWEEIKYGSIGSGIKKLLVVNNGVIAGTFGAGVFTSDNSLSKWNYSSTGFNKTLILELNVIDNENLFIRNSAGIFRFNLYTEKYEPLNGINNIIPEYTRILKDGSMLGLTYSGPIFKATNMFGPWVKITTSNNPSLIRMLSYPDSNTLFFSAADGDRGLYKSADLGSTWYWVRNDFTSCYSLTRIKNGNLLAGNVVWLYESKDNGETWEKITDFIFNGYILKIKVTADGNIFILTQFSGLYRSDDNGKSWKKIFNLLCNDILESNNHSLIIATENGIYKSYDKGDNWIEQSDELLHQNIRRIFETSSGRLYATTGDQIYVNNNTVTKVDDNKLPDSFNLMQNYPNPFNPSTTIRYSLPRDSKVKIEVYSVLGQKIKTILDEFQNAGFHEIIFNGQPLSSGVYFYQLSAGEFISTKKFILIK